MLTDISSEMIQSLLPAYLVGVVGLSVLHLGVIEGIAEATASVVKLASGALSDRMGRRKPLAALGYALSALARLAVPLAATFGPVVAARFADRLGKGIRDAPRDALIADLVPEPRRGAAFGLRQALDTVGAVVGPALTIVVMLTAGAEPRAMLWIAAIPGALGVLVMLLAVRDAPASARAPAAAPAPLLRRRDLALLPSGFRWVVACAAVFSLARFSEAFLVLRGHQLGLAFVMVPAVLMAMNIVYALGAYPAGALADRMDRRSLLALGIAVLVAADLTLAAPIGLPGLWLGVALWGVHLALTQGLIAALVADAAPPELRGTAFGVFNLCVGIMQLAASVAGGALWQRFGPAVTFASGAAIAASALVLLLFARHRIAGRPAGG